MTRSVKQKLLWAGIITVGVVFLIANIDSRESTSNAGSVSAASQVQFEVWGDAPNGVEITYGRDGTNLAARLPMNKVVPLENDASYYVVTAQLHGGGNITCTIYIGETVKTGHARGGYNICSAQLSNIGGEWR